MSRTMKSDERKMKSGRPRIIVSKKRPNLLAVLRNRQDPEMYVDEMYRTERYQRLHEH